MKKLKLIWRAWRYRYRLDPGEITFILGEVQKGDLVVDVGAHKGAYTYWLARAVGKEGSVFAFEPQPALAKSLERLFAHDGRVIVHHLALSSRNQDRALFIPGWSSSPGATLEKRSGTEGRHIDVPTTTLDSFFKGRDVPISLIKCDVEGHELEVFKGARSILETDRPMLLFECENRHLSGGTIQDVFTFLEELGYEGAYFQGIRLRQLAELSADQHGDPSRPNYVNNFLFR